MLDSLPDNPPNRALWYALCANEAINGGGINGGIGSGIFVATIFNRIALAELILWYSVLDVLVNVAQASDLSSSGTGAQYAKCVNLYNKKHGYGLIGGQDPPPPAWQGADGTGQTVGLVEFDTFHPSDVVDFIALTGSRRRPEIEREPRPRRTAARDRRERRRSPARHRDVSPLAPGAQVVVYDAPLEHQLPGDLQRDDQSTASTSSATAGRIAKTRRRSPTCRASTRSCRPPLRRASACSTAPATRQHVSRRLAEHRRACRRRRPRHRSRRHVAADEPPASPTAAKNGGTAATHTPPTGQGGFGVSRFFARPAYQNGLNASAGARFRTSSRQRRSGQRRDDLPGRRRRLSDRSAVRRHQHARRRGRLRRAAQPGAGHEPRLSQSAIYPFAQHDAFHNAASMGSDFAHVGLGSPNLARLHHAPDGSTAHRRGESDESMLADLVADHYSRDPPCAFPLPALADGRTQTFVVVALRRCERHSGRRQERDAASERGATARFTTARSSRRRVDGAAIFYRHRPDARNVTLKATDTTDGIVLAQTADRAYVPPWQRPEASSR